MTPPGLPQAARVDKWLWHARFFKTRGLAREAVTRGRVRVNSRRISKASSSIAPGDVLTFPQGRAIRVVRVEGIGVRRGPAREARALYSDLAPPGGAGRAPGPETGADDLE